MKNLKRIALCVIALTLVCQIAFAAVDITGAWVGTMSIAGYNSPKVYGVVDGTKDSGKLRFVLPNVGSGTGLKGQYVWRTDLTGGEKLYVNVALKNKSFTMYFNAADVEVKKNKLLVTGTVPDGIAASLKDVPFFLTLAKQDAGIKKIISKKAKVGVISAITVKTTDVTDYVVLTDATGKVLDIDTNVVAKLGGFAYGGWTKGKNILYVYAGLKDGDGKVKIKAAVGGTLSLEDKLVLSAPKKIVKKAK